MGASNDSIILRNIDIYIESITMIILVSKESARNIAKRELNTRDYKEVVDFKLK